MKILCSARNSKSIRSALSHTGSSISIIYVPFPISAVMLLTQKFSDFKLRNYPVDLKISISLKIFLKELYSDAHFKTPYSHILFKLYLVKYIAITGCDEEELNRKSKYQYKNLVFSRSSICDIQRQNFELEGNSLNKIQREGIESPTLAIKKLIESEIIVWRIGSTRIPKLPIRVKKFLTENSEPKKLFDASSELKTISAIEVENAVVSKGFYAEKGNFIYPNTPYFETEVSSSVSCTMPFYDRNRNIRTVPARNTLEFESAVFGGFNSNYYHFTWEIAPRLINFYDKRQKGISPVILNGQISKSLIEFTREISGVEPILIGDDQKALVQKLFLIYDGRYASQVDYTTSSTVNIFASREQDLSKIREVGSKMKLNAPIDNSRKFFVGRPESDARVPSNLDEVRKTLSLHSFQEIAVESISLGEQISLFREAEEICIITGAAVTNLLHCQKLRNLVILVIDQSPAFLVFWHQYCEFLGLKPTFIYSRNSKNLFGPIQISDLNQALVKFP